MSRDKIDVNEFVDSKNDGIGGSDIMKALEDIEYDISQSDIDFTASKFFTSSSTITPILHAEV